MSDDAAAVPHPALLARRLATVIAASKVDVSTEGAAHRALIDVLEGHGFNPVSEVSLGKAGRVDIMVDRVAIEVKATASVSRRGIYRQLERYAACSEVMAVVLASSGAWPTMTKIGDVPFFHASLSMGWLG